MAAAAPVDFIRDAGVYFATLVEVQKDNAELRHSQLEAAQRLLRFEQVERDNAQLRELLGMAPAVACTASQPRSCTMRPIRFRAR